MLLNTLLNPFLIDSNAQIFSHLKSLADSPHFSTIKTSFTEKCPYTPKKCSLSSCSLAKSTFQNSDGSINLLAVKESYSPHSDGSAVWASIYSLASASPELSTLISGLHFSVTTHLSAFHTVIFNRHFPNPLLFRKKFKNEHLDNFYHLYSLIRAAVASLSVNQGEIPEEARVLSTRVERVIIRERRKMKSDALYRGSYTGRPFSQKPKDVENDNNLEDARETSSTEDFLSTLPRISRDHIETINEMAKHVACLQCERCKLWGTIQIKGIKSAVKALNRMPLFKNETIFLINLFRQLSITMVESEKMINMRVPHAYMIITRHRQVLTVIMSVLAISFGYIKIRARKMR